MASVDVFCLENMKIYGDCMLGFDKKSKEMQQCFSKHRDCFGLSYSGCSFCDHIFVWNQVDQVCHVRKTPRYVDKCNNFEIINLNVCNF